LQLINDFDFILEHHECCTYDFYYKFGVKYNITLNGNNPHKGKKNQGNRTLLHVMRSPTNNNLFEMTVCAKYEMLELPLTSMKLEVTKANVVELLSFLQNYYENNLTQTDFEFLTKINIDVPNHDINGMFVVDHINLSIFSTQVRDIICSITNDKNSIMCLKNLISEPTNLSRFKWKNLPKTDKIRMFYSQYLKSECVVPLWLPNTNLISFLIDQFIFKIKELVNNIYITFECEIKYTIYEINKYDSLYRECINKLNNPVENNLLDSHIKKVYAELKLDSKLQRDNFRNKLTELYIDMFDKLNIIFKGINIIRWKNYIGIYKNLYMIDNIECILCIIFNFVPEIKLKLIDGSNIIVFSEELYNNDIWLVILELGRIYQ